MRFNELVRSSTPLTHVNLCISFLKAYFPRSEYFLYTTQSIFVHSHSSMILQIYLKHLHFSCFIYLLLLSHYFSGVILHFCSHFLYILFVSSLPSIFRTLNFNRHGAFDCSPFLRFSFNSFSLLLSDLSPIFAFRFISQHSPQTPPPYSISHL